MTYFDLLLTPNRPLPPRSAVWIVGAVTLVFAACGLRMALLGAWPVLPFLLADVLLLGWALWASYRSGRASQRLRLERHLLTVSDVSERGEERCEQLEPFWVRVQLQVIDRDENRLWLVSRGRRIAIGSFLSPDERAALHPVIADGLRRARQPVG